MGMPLFLQNANSALSKWSSQGKFIQNLRFHEKIESCATVCGLEIVHISKRGESS
jgi:hypothetical protein